MESIVCTQRASSAHREHCLRTEGVHLRTRASGCTQSVCPCPQKSGCLHTAQNSPSAHRVPGTHGEHRLHTQSCPGRENRRFSGYIKALKDKPSCGNGSAGRFVLRCRQRFSGSVPGPFCGSPALFRDVPEPLRERRGSPWSGEAAWIFCRWEQAAFPRMRQKSRKRYGRVLQTGSPPGSRIRDGFPAGFFMRRPAGLYKDRASCRDALCCRIWAAGLRKTQVRRRNCSGFAGREGGRAAFRALRTVFFPGGRHGEGAPSDRVKTPPYGLTRHNGVHAEIRLCGHSCRNARCACGRQAPEVCAVGGFPEAWLPSAGGFRTDSHGFVLFRMG